ncbi:UNVERIFIED_CONTAM: hypothetical protein HDU68_005700, partial [Siphonaria sp. JEL0065]
KLVHPTSVKAVLVWSYTGDIPRDYEANVEFLARQWKLWQLAEWVSEQNEAMLGNSLSIDRFKKKAFKRDTKGVQESLQLLVWCLTDIRFTSVWFDKTCSGCSTFEDYQIGLERIRKRYESEDFEKALKPMEMESGVTLLNGSRPDIVVVQYITKLYAHNFDVVIQQEEFKALVRDSAESVINREEVDTVIFVDDLKWWLARTYGFDGEDDIGVVGKNGEILVKEGQNVASRRDEFERKVGMLDELLHELGF